MRYKIGWDRLGTTQIYVSRGIGTIVLPWRLRCPAEISHLELLQSSSGASQARSGLTFKRMRVVDLIRRKRDSGELTREEIEQLIAAYTRGDVPDYQMSAWLMAVVLRGMSRQETAALTEAMLHSGSVLDFSDLLGQESGQAFHRGRGRQAFARDCPDRRRWGVEGTHDQRTGPGAQRRDARQARIHSRLQRQSVPGGFPARAGNMRVRPDRPDGRNCPGGQENLRSARRYRRRWKARR